MEHWKYNILYVENTFIHRFYLVSIDLYVIFHLWYAFRKADIKKRNMVTKLFYAVEQYQIDATFRNEFSETSCAKDECI